MKMCGYCGSCDPCQELIQEMIKVITDNLNDYTRANYLAMSFDMQAEIAFTALKEGTLRWALKRHE